MTTVAKYIVTSGFTIDESYSGFPGGQFIPAGSSVYVNDTPPGVVVLFSGGTYSYPGIGIVESMVTGPYSSRISFVGEVSQQDIVFVGDYANISRYAKTTCSVWEAEQDVSSEKEVLHFSPLDYLSLIPLGVTTEPEREPLKAAKERIYNINEVGFSGPPETEEIFRTQNVPVAFDIEKPDGSTVQVRHGHADLVVPLDQTALVFTTAPVINRPFRLRVIDFTGGVSGGATGTFYQSVVQQSLNADSEPITVPVFSVSQCTGIQSP